MRQPLGTLTAVALAAVILAACSPEEAPPSPEPLPTEASLAPTQDPVPEPAPETTVAIPPEQFGEVSVFDITTGMCSTRDAVDAASSTEAGVSVFPTVDCAEPHDLEVYATYEMTDAEFPGPDATRAVAEEQCLAAFESYVGRPYATSTLEFTWLSPNQQTWDQLGDRQVFCLLQAGEPVEGSFAGSGL